MGEDPVEPVAQALRVGRRTLHGGAEPEGGADDVIPGAEAFAQFGVGGVGQLRLEELPGDVERDPLLLVAAAGGQHGAATGGGAPADLGEQGGLAEPGGGGVREYAAAAQDLGASGSVETGVRSRRAPGTGRGCRRVRRVLCVPGFVAGPGLGAGVRYRDQARASGFAGRGDVFGPRRALGQAREEVESLLGRGERRLALEEAVPLTGRTAVLTCHVPPPHRGRAPGAQSGAPDGWPRQSPSVRPME